MVGSIASNTRGEVKAKVVSRDGCFVIDVIVFYGGHTSTARVPGKMFSTLGASKKWVEENWSEILAGEFSGKG